MTEDERIQRHLEIVQRIYERLVAEGEWEQLQEQIAPSDVRAD